MPGPLRNPRHEAYANARASGLEGADAWMAVRPKTSRVTAYGQACRFAKDTAINARIAELTAISEALAENAIKRAEARIAEKLDQETDRKIDEIAGAEAEKVARIIGDALTQAELLAFVTNIVLAKPSDLNGGDSMLVESIKPGKYGDTLEVCDKLRAAELAAKLQGFLVDKSEVVDKTPREPLAELRKRVDAARALASRS